MLLFFSAFNFWSGISFSMVWDNLLILLFFCSFLFQSLLLTNLHRSHPSLMPPLLHTWGFVSRSSIKLHWPARNFLPGSTWFKWLWFTIFDISFKCPFEEPMPSTWLRYIRPEKLLPQHGQLSSPCAAQNCKQQGSEPPRCSIPWQGTEGED